jgi:hypothetical protein
VLDVVGELGPAASGAAPEEDAAVGDAGVGPVAAVVEGEALRAERRRADAHGLHLMLPHVDGPRLLVTGRRGRRIEEQQRGEQQQGGGRRTPGGFHGLGRTSCGWFVTCLSLSFAVAGRCKACAFYRGGGIQKPTLAKTEKKIISFFG